MWRQKGVSYSLTLFSKGGEKGCTRSTSLTAWTTGLWVPSRIRLIFSLPFATGDPEIYSGEHPSWSVHLRQVIVSHARISFSVLLLTFPDPQKAWAWFSLGVQYCNGEKKNMHLMAVSGNLLLDFQVVSEDMDDNSHDDCTVQVIQYK